jgi:hypothetical protein
LIDWLDYEYWEGLSDAINYYPDLMAAQLNALELPKLAIALKSAWYISVECVKKYKEGTVGNFLAHRNTFQMDKDYKQAGHYFAANRHLMVERLFRFIKTHADQFL